MRRDQNFKLPKSVKRMYVTMVDKSERKMYKEMMINAELVAKTPRKSKKELEKDDDDSE